MVFFSSFFFPGRALLRQLPGLLAGGLFTGMVVGCVIGVLRMSHTLAGGFIADMLAADALLFAPVWFLVLIFVAVLIRRLVLAVPLISGSGIPQTELALAGKLPLPWLHVLAAKFVGSWLALAAGLTLGREGPSIQMGGAAGEGCGILWRKLAVRFPAWNRSDDREGKVFIPTALAKSPAMEPEAFHPGTFGELPTAAELSERPLLQQHLRGSYWVTGGAVAGLAAAFGAPLAGILFAFEEMKCRFGFRLALFACAAALGAHCVIRFGFQMGQILPFSAFMPLRLADSWVLVPLGIVLGMLGVVYNRSLLWLKDREAAQRLIPDRFRAVPPFLCAGIAALFLPQIAGGGESLIIQLGQTQMLLRLLFLLVAFKFAFALYSVTADIPGGLLMPILCLGALWGSLWGAVPMSLLAEGGFVAPGGGQACLLLGMAGFFAATVRAPLTGIALVMELSGAWACLPSALVVAFTAFVTANALHCPPVYDSLKSRIRLPVSP